MNERERALRADLVVLRSMTHLCIVATKAMISEMGVTPGLIEETRRQEILREIYDGTMKLAVRLSSWEEAFKTTRDTCMAGHPDPLYRQAGQLWIWQTEYLVG